MRVVFTGGGTGGHFYPLIAVADELNQIAEKENLAEVRLYYFSNTPYDKEALRGQGMEYREIPAGPLNLGGSLENILSVFKLTWGIVVALRKLFAVYPDVVFAKGGYASFPTIMAAFFLRIPIVVHESDSAPGRVTRIASKFAKRVAVSYGEAVQHFPEKKTAHVGQPIRRSILRPATSGAFEYLGLDRKVPTILVIGGSTGAVLINEAILNILPQLVERYQIIHQTGKKNLADVQQTADFLLTDNPNRYRYKAFDYLNDLATSMAAGAADLVVTRAGSQLFEIAAWGIPALVIPRTNSVNNHNMKNAYALARAGAGVVIEEKNLKSHILMAEINRIFDDKRLYQSLKDATQSFYKAGAGEAIAREIVAIAQSHE